MDIKESFPYTHSFIQYINKVEISSGTEYYHLIDMSVPEGNKEPISFEMKPELTYNEQYLSGEFAIKVRNLLELTRNEILFQYNTDPDKSQVIINLLRFLIDKLSNLPKSLLKLIDIFSAEDYDYPSFQKSIEDFKNDESVNLSKFYIPDYHFEKSNREKLIGFISKHLILIEESLEILQHIKLDSISGFTSPPKISKQYKPDLSRKQISLLFYFLRKEKVIHPETTSKAIGQGLSLMTGYKDEQLRKIMPSAESELKAINITENIKDPDEVILKLNAVIDRLNEFKIKLKSK